MAKCVSTGKNFNQNNDVHNKTVEIRGIDEMCVGQSGKINQSLVDSFDLFD